MLSKGDFVELLIEDMSNEGNGIGHASDGMTVFAEGAVVGDLVRVGISDVKKNYARGKAVKILKESELRRPEDEICPYIDKCGGCGYGKLKYDAQLRLKEKAVKDKLQRIGGIDFGDGSCEILPILGMENPSRYRNKATIAIYGNNVGFREKKSNMVVDCKDCLIQNPLAMKAADALRSYISDKRLEGVFSQAVVRVTNLNEVMILLYTPQFMAKQAELKNAGNNRSGKNGKGKDFGGKHGKMSRAVFENKGSFAKTGAGFKLSEEALEELSYLLDDATENQLESIWIDGKLIAGKGTVLAEMESVSGELRFEISPLSFYQVNSGQAQKLYEIVSDFAQLKGTETILDLYCGVGTIGLFLEKTMEAAFAKSQGIDPTDRNFSDIFAKEGGRIVGIESVKPAVIDANRNATINHIVNARYFAGKAEDELPFMMGMKKLFKPNEVNEMVERETEFTVEHADVAVLDPPRAGCDEALLDAVIKAAPERIVYVSCDPGTLARDVKYLSGNGFSLRKVQPVDMFGNTVHVETVVLMSRVKE